MRTFFNKSLDKKYNIQQLHNNNKITTITSVSTAQHSSSSEWYHFILYYIHWSLAFQSSVIIIIYYYEEKKETSKITIFCTGFVWHWNNLIVVLCVTLKFVIYHILFCFVNFSQSLYKMRLYAMVPCYFLYYLYSSHF